MAHYLTLTPSLALRPGRRKSTIKKTIQAGPVTLGYVAVFLLALICLFYLFQVVSISAAGYEVSAIDKEIESLEKENRALQLDINEAQSLHQIQSSLPTTKLIPVNSQAVKFVNDQGVIASR